MPIDPLQSWDAAELPDIARDKGSVVPQGGCRNQEIVGADGCPGAFQLRPDSCGVLRAVAVKWQQLQGLEELGERGKPWRSHVGCQARKPKAQFVLHDARNAQVHWPQGLKAAHHQRVAAKVVADRVAVQHQHGAALETKPRYIGGKAW